MELEAEAGSKRIAATVPATTWDVLETLATSARFGGNRSRAVAWSIDLAAVVLNDPAIADRLFATSDDALTAFVAAKAKRG